MLEGSSAASLPNPRDIEIADWDELDHVASSQHGSAGASAKVSGKIMLTSLGCENAICLSAKQR